MSGGGHGGGRGGRSRGGGHAEEPENSERWMVTYADMLTLLLVLFIVLYAISAVNVSKFNQLKSSLSSAFNGGSSPSVLPGGQGIVAGQPQQPSAVVGPKGPPTSNSTTGRPTAAAQAEQDNFAKIEKQVNQALKAKGLDGKALFTVNERGLVVTVLTNDVVFPPDSPQLLTGGEKILDTVMPSLNSVDNRIEVDGNVNQEISGVDGWTLSAQRAVAVLHYLIDAGHVGARRLTATGQGEFDPLVPANNPNAATLNRRVDITILSKYSLADRAGLFTPTGTATTAP